MWVSYVVNPFEGDNTGDYRSKPEALEDAQHRAISNPGEPFVVYRAKHYTDSDEGCAGMLDLIPVITYWYDKDIDKMQYEKG